MISLPSPGNIHDITVPVPGTSGGDFEVKETGKKTKGVDKNINWNLQVWSADVIHIIHCQTSILTAMCKVSHIEKKNVLTLVKSCYSIFHPFLLPRNNVEN